MQLYAQCSCHYYFAYKHCKDRKYQANQGRRLKQVRGDPDFEMDH